MLSVTVRRAVLPLLVACAPATAPGPATVSTPVSTEPGPAASAPGAKQPAPAANEPAPPEPATEAPPEPEPAPLPAGTRILHLGDSFADALGVPLGKRLRDAGLTSTLKFKTASYIPNWAHSPDVGRYLERYDPDLVLITLGSNEMEIPEPKDRIRPIQALVARLGGRPCVWITPPLWKRDTGLVAVLRDHVAPCRFLESDRLVHDLPLRGDHIHPSAEGREIWADAVYAWLRRARDPAGDRPWALKTQAELTP